MKLGKKKKEVEIKKWWWEKFLEQRKVVAINLIDESIKNHTQASIDLNQLEYPNKIWILTDELKKMMDEAIEQAQKSGEYLLYSCLQEPYKEKMIELWKNSHEVIEEIKILSKGKMA
jgi:hypothetical protein